MRKVIVYISMSLDGYLAKENDDISWLSIVEKEGEDYGYYDFVKQVDTYIVGRKTYDVVCQLVGEFPASKQYQQCYVLTQNESLQNIDNINFYTKGVDELIPFLKSQEGKNIYCDGGGQIVKMLLEKGYVDELIVSVIPILLGKGKPLFPAGNFEQQLELIESKSYSTGLVQLHYALKK